MFVVKSVGISKTVVCLIKTKVFSMYKHTEVFFIQGIPMLVIMELVRLPINFETMKFYMIIIILHISCIERLVTTMLTTINN